MFLYNLTVVVVEMVEMVAVEDMAVQAVLAATVAPEEKLMEF